MSRSSPKSPISPDVRVRAGLPGATPWIAPDPASFLRPFNDRSIMLYYRALFDWHGYIRFLGLPHLKDNPDVPIQHLYVEQQVSAQEIPPDRSPDTWPATQTALDAIAENPRLVVLGDPGSGKSTLVSWLAWGLSRPENNALTRRLGPLVPLPFVLRELKLGSQVTWEVLVDAFLAHPVGQPLGSAEKVDELLTSGQALVLLDGLDEIGSVDVRRKLRDILHTAFERYSSARWVVTSRIVGYDEVPFENPEVELPDGLPTAIKTSLRVGFANPMAAAISVPDKALFEDPTEDGWTDILRPESVMSVRYAAPFRDEQIEQFARFWYAQREAAEAVRREEVRDFIAAVRGHEHTLRLARVPILLTLMALIHRVTARLPHGRARLYAKIAEAYLESIDNYRKLPGPVHSLDRKRRWLGYVAFQMQLLRGETGSKLASAILVDAHELCAWLAEAMRRSGIEAPEREAREFVDYVGRRSGLLLPRAEGQFAFTHLSFQEFFAACHLQDQVTAPRWLEGARAEAEFLLSDLQKCSTDLRWRETLILLFELLAEKPDWSDELAVALFGVECSNVGNQRSRTRPEAVLLLAALSVDPHSGFNSLLRKQAREACWKWEVRRQQRKGESASPHVAQTLLSDASDDWDAWSTFEKVISRAKHLWRIDLTGCLGVLTLEPFSELNTLQVLLLTSCTRLRDLGPLSDLKQLVALSLCGCTSISDLTPLAGLESLQTLTLEDCSSINDLTPLSKLTSLRYVNLRGTGLQDDAARVLRPHVTIVGPRE